MITSEELAEELAKLKGLPVRKKQSKIPTGVFPFKRKRSIDPGAQLRGRMIAECGSYDAANAVAYVAVQMSEQR